MPITRFRSRFPMAHILPELLLSEPSFLAIEVRAEILHPPTPVILRPSRLTLLRKNRQSFNKIARCCHEPAPGSPSPLNGERAGVRGETVRLAFRFMPVAMPAPYHPPRICHQSH